MGVSRGVDCEAKSSRCGHSSRKPLGETATKKKKRCIPAGKLEQLEECVVTKGESPGTLLAQMLSLFC